MSAERIPRLDPDDILGEEDPAIDEQAMIQMAQWVYEGDVLQFRTLGVEGTLAFLLASIIATRMYINLSAQNPSELSKEYARFIVLFRTDLGGGSWEENMLRFLVACRLDGMRISEGIPTFVGYLGIDPTLLPGVRHAFNRAAEELGLPEPFAMPM